MWVIERSLVRFRLSALGLMMDHGLEGLRFRMGDGVGMPPLVASVLEERGMVEADSGSSREESPSGGYGRRRRGKEAPPSPQPTAMLVYAGPVDTGAKIIGQGVDDAGSLSVSLHHQGDWNLYWKSGRFRPSEYANVKPYQKMNHFPRSGCITRKDSLVRIMRRMAAVHGSQVYDFVPEAFILPNEYTKFVETYSEQDECSRAGLASYCEELQFRSKLPTLEGSVAKVWICKPADSSRGRNIFLLRNLEDLRYDSQFVIQRYIERPFLVGGYKCDLRVYVLVVSVHPLKAYIYRDGLVRQDSGSLPEISAGLRNCNLSEATTSRDSEHTHCKNQKIPS
ncbi:Tubulin tyrosine ligase-like, member [Perkinsus olseni]|uniref:Tubulin tyrosine ligase-like, member n=1 Tax=Perkinsus olseni TaxID=32597 RepID=A0A7J6TAT0_PEROL|nr:Tubulin tyrosine ligase-like, member [Perkinsus olseni]